MDYEALEQELVDRMNAYLAATPVSSAPDAAMLNAWYEARVMPEDDDEFTRAGDKMFLNVHYSDSVYEKSNSNSQIVQDELVIVEFFVQCLKRRGDKGALTLVKHLKDCLLGKKPTNGDRMYIYSYGDWDMGDSSVRMPFFEFAFKTRSVQKSDEPGPVGGPYKKTTVNTDT